MRVRICENCGEEKVGKMVRIRSGEFQNCVCCSQECAQELKYGSDIARQVENGSYWEARQMDFSAL